MLKYFNLEGNPWRTDNPVFNWVAIDSDGKVFLYQHRPFIKESKGYWTSGHTSSFDAQIPTKVCDTENWKQSLVEL